MQRKIYKSDRKKRQFYICTQMEDMYHTVVGQMRFVFLLATIREIFVGGKFGCIKRFNFTYVLSELCCFLLKTVNKISYHL